MYQTTSGEEHSHFRLIAYQN